MFEASGSYMLIYLLTTLVVFLGVYVGAILAFMVPEEVKPGKIYFRILAAALLIIIPLVLFYSYGVDLLLLVLLGTFAGICVYFATNINLLNQLTYFSMGVALFFSTKTSDIFALTAVLIFLYGIPVGTLYVADQPEKKSKRIILADMLLVFGFFLIAALISNMIGLFVLNT
jgi:hypothetical protein